MPCARATAPDDCCGWRCCEDAPEADSGAGIDSGTTPSAPAPIVARTGEQLYPVQPTPKETKDKGELLVAVTSKRGLQLKNQGEILLPTTMKPPLVLKNQGVQLSPVVTKGPHAEPVGEYIAPMSSCTRPHRLGHSRHHDARRAGAGGGTERRRPALAQPLPDDPSIENPHRIGLRYTFGCVDKRHTPEWSPEFATPCSPPRPLSNA